MLLRAGVAAFNRGAVWKRMVQVWDLVIQAPSFDRWLYLHLHRLRLMGREEKEFLEGILRPGMHVADIGANLGLYALLMARLVGPAGKVFAFEPDATMNHALRQNVRANAASQVEVFACAIGAETANGILRRDLFNSGDSRLEPKDAKAKVAGPVGEDGAVSTVAIRTLDESLPGQRLDFIKMDVQGWEGHALRGIDNLLGTNPHLVIYFEFWPKGLRSAGSCPAELKQILASRGLHVYRPDMIAAEAEIDLELEEHRLRPGKWVNLLAHKGDFLRKKRERADPYRADME